MISGRRPQLLLEILSQTARVGAKSPIFYLFSPAAPQPYTLSNEPKMNIVRCPILPKPQAHKRSVQNLNNKLR